MTFGMFKQPQNQSLLMSPVSVTLTASGKTAAAYFLLLLPKTAAVFVILIYLSLCVDSFIRTILKDYSLHFTLTSCGMLTYNSDSNALKSSLTSIYD